MPRGQLPHPGKQTPETQERAAEVIRLHQAGHTFEVIARMLGYRDRSGPRRVYERAMQRTVAVPAAEARQLELERLNAREAQLDDWTTEAERQLRMDHVTVSHGRIIPDVVDEGAKLAALDRLVKINQERRAVGAERRKLLGLDAPERHEVTSYDGDSQLDAEIAKLMADMESRGQGAPAVETPGSTGAAST